jgi:hypothetical protein
VVNSTLSPVSANVTSGRNPPAPAPEWSWLLKPTNGRGYLVVNGKTYQTTEVQFEHENGTGGRLWDLMLPDGKSCRVCQNADGDLGCDCEDSVYRQRRCKHSQAVEAAFADLDRAESLDSWLAAEADAYRNKSHDAAEMPF